VARFCEQFVSAFGVVGFSGVKDSRKSVHIADASASAGIYSANSKKKAQEKQSESKSIADPKQNRKQSQSKAVATAKRNDSKQGATCTPI
jgi:putative ubiquitin-RnfH superfamily antitoxin RatB of RatAB toxin-antitoxin module